MPMPKSVVKMKRGNLTFTSNVDQANYSIRELTRGALRDVGKYLRSKYRQYFYGAVRHSTGLSGGALQYWNRAKECDLQIGLWKTRKPAKGFWGGFYEIGAEGSPKLNIMFNMVQAERGTITEIESKYLSALNGEPSSFEHLIDEREQDNE